jgi:histone H3/H4
MEDNIYDITKPSITRLARRAGVKSVSDDCFNSIRYIIANRLDEIISTAFIVNSEHQTKTLMSDDIYDAFSLTGCNITQSSDLGTTTCSK